MTTTCCHILRTTSAMASLCRHYHMMNTVLKRSFSRVFGPLVSVTTPTDGKSQQQLRGGERSVALPQRCFASAKPAAQKKTVTLHFKTNDDTRTVQAKLGDNLLDVIIDNDVDIDGFGACEGTLACSTCHLVFTEQNFEALPEKPTDEELDMLDLAFGLQDTSRLGCQVIVSEDMEGWQIHVPEGVSDAREP